MKLTIRMKSLGEPVSKPEPLQTAATTVKEEVRYPEIVFNTQQINGIKDLKIGQEVTLIIEAEVKAAGKGLREYDDSEDEGWARFCLKMGAIQPEEEPKDMDDAFDQSMKDEMNARRVPFSNIAKTYG